MLMVREMLWLCVRLKVHIFQRNMLKTISVLESSTVQIIVLFFLILPVQETGSDTTAIDNHSKTDVFGVKYQI